MIITDVKMPYFDSIKTLPRLFNALNLCIQRDKSIEEITGIIERDPAIISAAGIVHDIGKIIMLQIFGDKYYNETVKVGLEDDQLMDVEKSMFGIDHSTLGGYFLNWWHLCVLHQS